MIGNDWDKILEDVLTTDWYMELIAVVDNAYKTTTVYPEYKNIFNALKTTPYNETKVVIIGQDPYHGENEAHGLAFSVENGTKLPPSLKNIFKELNADLGINRTNGNLTSWAKQGVFLLNTVLTVEKDMPMSHSNIGWNKFTDAVISKLNDREKPIVFVLWGEKAKIKATLITNQSHTIITSSHPSPFSARKGFFGSKVFSQVNNSLRGFKEDIINFDK